MKCKVLLMLDYQVRPPDNAVPGFSILSRWLLIYLLSM